MSKIINGGEAVMTTIAALEVAAADLNVQEANACKLFARYLLDAAMRGALYTTDRGLQDVQGHFEKRKAAAPSFTSKTQSIFNHGDGAPEESVVLAFRDSDGTAILILYYEADDDMGIHAAGFAVDRNNGVWFLPVCLIDREFITFRCGPWCRLNSTNSEDDEKMAVLYCGGLIYLDEQLREDDEKGGYGDGVNHNVLLYMPPADSWIAQPYR